VYNNIGGVMIGVLALSAVDPGFEPLSGQTKNYKNCICCFYTELWNKSKDLSGYESG
jgi:hypothetical protein